MTRADWHPLVEDGSNPVPGDPYAVGQLADRLRRTADAITSTADALKRLSQMDGWDADAGREFKDKANECADDIRQAHDRYDAAATALRTYQNELTSLQSRAETLYQEAVTAQQEQSTARSKANAEPPKDPDFVGPTARDSYEAQADAAEGRLADVRRRLQDVRNDHDKAGNTAANSIDTAMEADGLNDGFLDELRDFLKVVSKIAGIIATVCGILSLLVGWIPIIGQALAAVLGTIALIASVVSLVCNILMLINGDATWEDVMWDAISVASFGVGRVFSGAAKLSRLAGRSKAWDAARNLARVRNPNMNSAQIRTATQSLMGGPRAGARSWETLAQAPRGIFKGTGGMRAAYGKLGDEMAQWGKFTREAGRMGAGRTNLGTYLNDVGEVARIRAINPAVLAHGAEGAAAKALIRQGTIQDTIAIGAQGVGSFADAKQAGGLIGDIPGAENFPGYFTGRADLDVTGGRGVG